MSGASRRAIPILGLFARPEFLKFVVVGCVNTGLTLVLFWTLLNVLRWNYAIALTCTWVVGIVFNYCLNSVWSFRTSRRPTFDANFLRYALVYVAAFLLNLGLLAVLVDVLKLSPMVAQFILMPVIVAFNYLGVRLWALR